MARLLIPLLFFVFFSQAEQTEHENVVVKFKNLIFKPSHVPNAVFTGEADLVVCIGDYVESAGLDCRYFNSHKPFNITFAINDEFRANSRLPKKAVQINLKFKIHATLPEGKEEWKTFVYTTSSPLELGHHFPIAETAENYEIEGEMYVDCVDFQSRPHCVVSNEKSLADGKVGKRGLPETTEESKSIFLANFPSPAFNYILTSILIVIILSLIFIKVIYPRCIKKTPNSSAEARQML